MKIALVHDYLSQDGGAERVLASLQALYPQAPTFVLFHDREKANAVFAGKDIRTSFLQKIPGGVSRYQWLLPLMPKAVESLDLSGFDVVISSTSAFAKGIVTGEHSLHVCYCHTPTRYLWSDTHSYLADLQRGRLVKAAVRSLLPNLRLWDKAAAERVDLFVANSQAVARRIRKYYRRESAVIYPPVEVDKYRPTGQAGKFFLIGGRAVNYKRFDIAVDACSRLGLPLKVFGDGPALESLRRRAGKSVEFVGQVDDAEKIRLFQDCIAFINPQEEDFGITPVEAMAAGRPVLAYAAGGALETVVPGLSGELLDEQNWETLADRLLDFRPEKYDSAAIRRHAEKFSTENFHQNIRRFVEQKFMEFGK